MSRILHLQFALASFALASFALAQEPISEERLLARIPEGIRLEGTPEVRPDGTISTPRHSVHWQPNGAGVAYIGLKEGLSYPVIGDSVGKAWPIIEGPLVGPGEGNVVFRVRRSTPDKEQEWLILRGHEEVDRAEWIGPPSMAANGESIAYWAEFSAQRRLGGTEHLSGIFLCLARCEGESWKLDRSKRRISDRDSLSPPAFTPDSQRVRTVVSENSRWSIDVWGKSKCDRVFSSTFPIFESVFDMKGRLVAATVMRPYYSTAPSPPPCLDPG